MEKKFSFLSGSLAIENRPFHFQVADVIKKALVNHTGYLGYKLTTLGRASDVDVPSFIVVSQQSGIILIDVVEEQVVDVIETDSEEYWKLESGSVVTSRTLISEIYEEEVISRLKNDLALYDRKSRKVKVPITSVVIFCANDEASIQGLLGDDSAIDGVPFDDLDVWIRGFEDRYNCSDDELGRIYSLLEGTFVYETKRGPVVTEAAPQTINDYIQKSLRTTFKQDDAQRLAAMQLPPGPQRIRGLAGTGKTIVLSLKAAITHKRFPEFKILYLFNTQSLYQHVQNLISKYYTLEAKKAPDFDAKIHVLHAWGGRQKEGLYSKLCRTLGVTPLTLGDARGHGDPLTFIYRDLLAKMGDQIKPEYDLILIDEAQDFSSEIFQVAYKLAKGEGPQKRIIWAYDEFQSLRDSFIKGPAELFGLNASGEPNLADSILAGKYDGDIPKDFVLPNCYRTPRPVLMTAHGVAMGLYSNRQVEMFYYPGDWEAIGYRVNEPRSLTISEGDNVEIERPDSNSKNLLEGIMLENQKRPLNLVQTELCTTESEQLTFISQKISKLVATDGVAPEEIIIINLKSGSNKESMLAIQRSLNTIGVRSVIPGYVESADVFKPVGFVTITTPYRAKGNEANIVFVMNAQHVANDFTFRMRNAFFVAVTRSRGWCYISGFGQTMQKLIAEIDSIKNHFPKFKFVCPSPAQVNSNKSFLNKSDKELDKLQEIFELMEKNPEFREMIRNYPQE
ncbi:DEAD/DEAH box helicase [Pseudomonas putida]|uniref:DEAD/DEAH box helicase n=1 Tax=Pseudomonas putida TaxID=303 RepID=UPI0018E699EF|nr:ATP-binding domain-containing protein [Pseudomonas putida]MBI6923346.1 DEAD/DEAH box helicase [Pseudomonas putida]